jgi:hypothetical protein
MCFLLPEARGVSPHVGETELAITDESRVPKEKSNAVADTSVVGADLEVGEVM